MLLSALLMVLLVGFVAGLTLPLPVTGLLLFLGGVGWAGVTVNSLPMLLDLGPEGRLGTRAGLYYLSFALAGLLGPWLTRLAYPVVGSRGIWLILVCWALAFSFIALMRPDAGEVETPSPSPSPTQGGPDSPSPWQGG